jgi:hypothetical protein
MALEGLAQLACGGIPELDGLVMRAGRQ